VWHAGDVIVHHEVWGGRVWAARPLSVVEDTGDRLLLWIPRGTMRKVPATPPGRPDPATRRERVIENLARGDWVHVDHEWDMDHLWLLRPRDWHALWVSWVGGRHIGWYGNLQRPFRRTAAGIEAMDLMLDVVVEPDLTWRWKDEDEFADLVGRGLVDGATADRVRRAGEEIIDRAERRAGPFAEAWPDWRPDPALPRPVLPDGWDRVPDGLGTAGAQR